MCDVYISVVSLNSKYWLIWRQDYVIFGLIKTYVIMLFRESVNFDVWGKEIKIRITEFYISVVGLINKYWLIWIQDYVISGFVKI
jgi:hypothetical protein